MNDIIHEGKVPADWSDSIIVTLFKGKRYALEPEQLSWTEHVLKVIERVVEYVKQLTLIKCSLASAPVEAQQMQFLFSDTFKRSIS